MWTGANFDLHLVNDLLEFGLDHSNPSAWKGLASLLAVSMEAKQQCKPLLASMVQVKFREKVREALECTRDFQLANYLIELLVFLFPGTPKSEKNAPKTTPVIWQDPHRNSAFFGDPLYPQSRQSGMKFVLKRLGPFYNFGKITSLSYSIRGSKKAVKQVAHPVCLQLFNDLLYVWTEDWELIEMQVKGFDVAATLTRGLQLRPLKDLEVVTFSPHANLLNSLHRATCFYVECSDHTLANNIVSQNRNSKISEVTSFISLSFNVSSEDDCVVSRGSGPSSHLEEVSTSGLPIKEALSSNDAAACLYPLKNDGVDNTVSAPGIKVDEWDFEPSVLSAHPSQHPHVLEKFDASDFSLHETSDNEQSPLVLAQKRRRERVEKRSLHEIKHTTVKSVELGAKKKGPLPDARTITSAFVTNQLQETQPPKPKFATSIREKDLLQLESIFNHKRVSTHSKKRIKKDVTSVTSLDHGRVERSVVPNVEPPKPAHTRKRKLESHRADPESTKLVVQQVANKPLENKADPSPEKCERHPMESSTETTKITTGAPTSGPEAETEKGTCKVDNSLTQVPHKIPDAAESTNLESTTIASTTELFPMNHKDILGTSFTNKLQEQIFSSINSFSNDLVNKMRIINEELNNKICLELSQKYQNLFTKLQTSFEQDVTQMSQFMGEIKDLLHLPEDQLVNVIRHKKFDQS